MDETREAGRPVPRELPLDVSVVADGCRHHCTGSFVGPAVSCAACRDGRRPDAV
ncbi:hypothetical protein AB0A70_16950 [Streptomyces morookaense]|uniref:hypothetical protein n=1 Tax=Streptomyces morookaense TaxID=1970 RepID=UPI0033D55123